MSNISHRNERGFTLVELSIVLVIIGLLIGAVLKGQELIESARVKSLVTQIDSYKTATSIFRDRFRQLPGDFDDGVARLGASGEGDNDGIIEGNGNTTEGIYFWEDLVLAGLITGTADVSGGVTDVIPDSKMGGVVNALNADVQNGMQDTNMLRVGNNDGGGQSDVDLVTGAEAGEIDDLFDDGIGNAGDIQATGAVDCRNATTGVYNFTDGDVACQMIWRLQ